MEIIWDFDGTLFDTYPLMARCLQRALADAGQEAGCEEIRAQMAAAGWPLLGDGKYGRLDKRYDRKYQALYSYKLTFRFTTDAGCLSYLDGKTFEVESVDFVQEYFT